MNLIHTSKKKIAKKIRRWLDNQVIPALIKYGTYSMQPAEINIKLFYDSVAISIFFGKAVVYIGYVGYINGEHLIKYGLSRNIFKRDYEQHSKTFETFQVVFIGKPIIVNKLKIYLRRILKFFGYIVLIKLTQNYSLYPLNIQLNFKLVIYNHLLIIFSCQQSNNQPIKSII